ncbi:hypothetical protein ABK046_33430 [Streptomyces caeruleatus]
MTSIDRTGTGTEPHGRRLYAWVTVVTTLATLATILVLALTGNGNAAAAVGAVGILSGAAVGTVQITVNIRR